jgi:excisionase family DNA binding protein
VNYREQLEDITREGDRDKLLTKEQAAALLEVPVMRFYRMALAGRVPRVVLGGRTVRYRMSDIRQMIRESTERRD